MKKLLLFLGDYSSLCRVRKEMKRSRPERFQPYNSQNPSLIRVTLMCQLK